MVNYCPFGLLYSRLIGEQELAKMSRKPKRKPSEDLKFKIMLLYAKNVDCKVIAKKVKYSESVVRNIIDSTPQIPLQQIMSTYDGDFKSIAEKTNYSEEQVQKIISTFRPNLRLRNMSINSTLSPNCSDSMNRKYDLEMVFANVLFSNGIRAVIKYC